MSDGHMEDRERGIRDVMALIRELRKDGVQISISDESKMPKQPKAWILWLQLPVLIWQIIQLIRNIRFRVRIRD